MTQDITIPYHLLSYRTICNIKQLIEADFSHACWEAGQSLGQPEYDDMVTQFRTLIGALVKEIKT